MKKIRITENELVDLIEKLVKENLSNGTGFDFGMVGTPTSKYKDLYEDDDVESEDELEESNGEEEQLNINVTDQPGSDNEDEWMESITESQLVKRLTRKLHEDDGRAMQDMTKDIERRGTEGSFRKWCQSKNKSWDGCSPECWRAAMETNDTSLHRKVSGAKFYCK